MDRQGTLGVLIDKIGEADSPYYGGSALFLLDTMRLLGLYGTLTERDLGWRFIVYGSAAVEGDAQAFKGLAPTELAQRAGEYACYARYVKAIGKRYRDRFLLHSLSILEPIVADMAQRSGQTLMSLNGTTSLAFPVSGTGALYELVERLSHGFSENDPVIAGYETLIPLALFRKLLIRRSRLRSAPPVDIAANLRLIAEIEDGTALSVYQNLLALKAAARRAFAHTKNSVRYDYRFIARELGAIAQVG